MMHRLFRFPLFMVYLLYEEHSCTLHFAIPESV